MKESRSYEEKALETFLAISLSLVALTIVYFFAEAKYNDLFHGLPPPEHSYNQRSGSDAESAVTSATRLSPDSASGKAEDNKEQQSPDFDPFKAIDIRAQEGMWRAANHLVALAFLQLFATIITIGYIYGTFKVQKRELDSTKEANAHQLKAYLSLDAVEIKWQGASFDGKKGYFRAVLVVKNTGKTPAKNISHRATSWLHITFGAANSIEFSSDDRVINFVNIKRTLDPGQTHRIVVALQPTTKDTIPRELMINNFPIKSGEIEPIAFIFKGWIGFEDIFDETERLSEFEITKGYGAENLSGDEGRTLIERFNEDTAAGYRVMRSIEKNES